MTASRRSRVSAVAALVLAILALGLGASVEAQAADDGPMLVIREIDGSDPDAVKVTFLWTGSENGLRNMTLREEGDSKDVDVTSLRNAGTSTITVFVIDTSDSMGDSGALSATKDELHDFVSKVSGGDEVALVSYTSQVHVETPPTSDEGTMGRGIDELTVPRGARSAMYDAIRRASLITADRSHLQGNIVLVTDGADDGSRVDLDHAEAAVAKAGAALFVVDLQHDGGTDRSAVQAIVNRTGGAIFDAPAVEDVGAAFTDLGVTMQKQYVATYQSSAEQGDTSISLTVDGVEQRGSFVVGARAQGAGTAESEVTPKSLGPSALRNRSVGMTALLLIGVAFGLGAYAVIQLSTKSTEGLDAVLRPYEEGGLPDEMVDQGLAQTALLQRAVEITEDFAERQGFLDKVAGMLERADLPLRAAEALFFYLASAVVVGFLGFVLFGLPNALFVLLLVVLGPPAALNFLAERRSKAFQAQLPDTLQLLSGSLKAGYSLLQGVEAVSQEVDEPMGKELRRVMTEARLGREVEEALDGVSNRMESPDFAWAVMAIRIQREVGGNLAELLETVSETMVQRERLRRDINSLTAEGKISAIVLGLLPVGLGLFMYMANRDYMEVLTTETIGLVLLGVATVSALIGFAWMKKIINIDL